MKKTYPIIIILLSISCATKKQYPSLSFDLDPDLSHIEYSQNSGLSLEDAILILNAKNSNEGVSAEYAFLNEKYGVPGVDWMLKERGSYTIEETKKVYDEMLIELVGSKEQFRIYFDITSFYGKW